MKIYLILIFLFYPWVKYSAQVPYYNWRLIDTGIESKFISITSTDSANGWVLSDNSILHTSNGGETWIYQATIDSAKFIQILFLDNKIGFVTGGGGLLKTTDGGFSWNKSNMFPGKYSAKLSFYDNSTGWLIVNKDENEVFTEFVFKTNDSGLTWDTLLVKNDAIKFYDIKFIDSLNGFIIGSDGHDNFAPIYFYKTTDGGKNWDNTSVFTGAHTFYLSVGTKDTLWAGGFGFAKSCDGGKTWDTDYKIINEDSVLYGQPRFYDFLQISGSKGYTVNTTIKKNKEVNHNLCYTDDCGSSWMKMEVPINFKSRCITSTGKYIIVGGEEGKIIINNPLIVNVKYPISHDLPFVLYRNYPNPFNPTTNIKFALLQNSRVVLEVYGMLGEKVATLVNEVKSAGYHESVFNGGNLSSGIYIYRLTAVSLATGKQFVKYSKMMLIK